MLTPDQIDDFVELTLNAFKRNSWTDLSLEYQEYVFAKIVKPKMVVEQGGPQVAFKIKTKNTGNARISGMFDADNIGVDDVMQGASVPWSKQVTGFAYDIDEDMFQSDRETIIRELKIREHDAMSDMAELMEEKLWSAPSGPSDKSPMGIPFWLQKDATTTPEGGFNGGNPAGFTAGCAGVSSVDFPRWRNWTFGYTKVSTDDMVRKVKKAISYTRFMAPVPHPEVAFGDVKYEIFTTYRVQEPLERLAESRNDNLGTDVARYMGKVTIGGIPLGWVPYLDANDTTDPLYGVNWKVFRPFVKKGCNMRRSAPKIAPRQHTVREVFFDNWMNYICSNRRLCFAGSKAA